MKILILEDSGNIFEAIKENLNGHEVFNAYQISEAIDTWEKYKIDFIISDLNVPGSGLNPDEAKEAEGGKIAGYIWLKNYIYSIDEKWIDKSIIYSGFTNDLMESMPYNEYEKLNIVKKEEDNSIEKLISKLNKLT